MTRRTGRTGVPRNKIGIGTYCRRSRMDARPSKFRSQVAVEAGLATYLQGEEETSRRVILLLAVTRCSTDLVVAPPFRHAVYPFMNQSSKAAADSQFSMPFHQSEIFCRCAWREVIPRSDQSPMDGCLLDRGLQAMRFVRAKAQSAEGGIRYEAAGDGWIGRRILWSSPRAVRRRAAKSSL